MQWTKEKQQAIEAGARALHQHRIESQADAPLHVLEAAERSVPAAAFPSIAAMFMGHLEAVNDTEWGEIVRAAEEAQPRRCGRCEHEAHSGMTCYVQTDPPDYDFPRKCGCDSFTHKAAPFDPLALFSAFLLEGLAKGEQGRNDCDYHVRLHPDEKCTCQPPVPSWFNAHAKFRLPGGNCVRCNFAEDATFAHQNGGRMGHAFRDAGRPFIIPPLTFTYDDGATT